MHPLRRAQKGTDMNTIALLVIAAAAIFLLRPAGLISSTGLTVKGDRKSVV